MTTNTPTIDRTDFIVSYRIAVEWRHKTTRKGDGRVDRDCVFTTAEEFTVSPVNLEDELKAILSDLIGNELISLTITGRGEAF